MEVKTFFIFVRGLKLKDLEIGGGKLEDRKEMELNEKEQKLIKLIREIEFGELKIVVQNSIPIRVEEIKRSIKL